MTRKIVIAGKKLPKYQTLFSTIDTEHPWPSRARHGLAPEDSDLIKLRKELDAMRDHDSQAGTHDSP